MKKIVAFFAIVFTLLSCSTTKIPVGQKDESTKSFYIRYAPDTIPYKNGGKEDVYLLNAEYASEKFKMLFCSKRIFDKITGEMQVNDLTPEGYSPVMKVVATYIAPLSRLEKDELNKLAKDDQKYAMALNSTEKWLVTGSYPVTMAEAVQLNLISSNAIPSSGQNIQKTENINPPSKKSPVKRAPYAPGSSNQDKKRVWKNGAWVYQ